MGRYGIGARVRDGDGDEGVIVAKRKGEREVGYDDGSLLDGLRMWLPKAELTAVVTEKPSTEKGEVAFAVGDRVVWPEGDVIDDDRRPPNSVGVIEGDFNKEIARVLFEPPFEGWGQTDRNWHVKKSDLQPFRLEAGRLYRTRDGRKVGPMEAGAGRCIESARDGTQVAAFHEDEAGSYTADGIWLTSDGSANEDIVGLWTEPVAEPAPATLTIEAGRYYRTRDGRKVGPMESAVGWTSEYAWRAPGSGPWLYHITGRWGDGSHDDGMDLVAEWVEPAAAKQPKFKVGDKVDLMRDGRPSVRWSNMTITSMDNDSTLYPIMTDGGLQVHEDELRLSPAKPKFKAGPGKRYRGKSGAEYDVIDSSGNEFWPLKTADNNRFWKVDGTAYNEGGWNAFAPPADDLVAEVAPKFPIGTKVTLTATVTGIYDGGVNVLVDGIPAATASRAFPATSLKKAA